MLTDRRWQGVLSVKPALETPIDIERRKLAAVRVQQFVGPESHFIPKTVSLEKYTST